MQQLRKGASMNYERQTDLRKIVIIGQPNVGKSALLNRITGTYGAVISNYPGTTVEVSQGKVRVAGEEFEVVDTPGMYSLLPITEEEKITRLILFDKGPCVILQVIDAKNLERHLNVTLQFQEAGFPLILVLNIYDEARDAGIAIDVPALERELGLPVVTTVSTTGEGLDMLRRKIEDYVRKIS